MADDPLMNERNYIEICKEMQYRSLRRALGDKFDTSAIRSFIQISETISKRNATYALDHTLKDIAKRGYSYLIAEQEIKDSIEKSIKANCKELLRQTAYNNIDENGEYLPCPSFKTAIDILSARVFHFMTKLFPKPILTNFKEK